MFSSLILAAVIGSAWAQSPDDNTSDDNTSNETASESETAAEKAPKDASTEGMLAGPYSKKPYAKPVLGAMVWNGAVGLSAGAEAGLMYKQKKPDPAFFGKTRIMGAYTFGAGISGYDVRLGSFFGPFYKVVGAQTGPDVFYSQYQFPDTEMPATTGLEWPITGLLDLKVFDAYAGVSPGWYFGGDRENLNAVLGQYGLYAGAGINLSKLRLHLGWSKTTTAYGEQTGISVGIGI